MVEKSADTARPGERDPTPSHQHPSAKDLAQQWLDGFNAAIDAKDCDDAARHFDADGYWRDILSFSWHIVTERGPARIAEALRATLPSCEARDFRLESQEPQFGQLGAFRTVEAFFRFDTHLANGRGFMRLVLDPDGLGGWKALNFLTTLHELKAFPEDAFLHRQREGVGHRGLENWLDRRTKAAQFDDSDPEVLIIGAGQAGLALGARLTQLKVSTLIVDKHERVGDNWRKRYHSLTLHNEICTNHLPYLPFPKTWPVYLPKDMLANFLEFYAMSMELNVWTGTEFLGGEYDADTQRWTVRVKRADGSFRTLRPRQVVMAIGASGIANVPKLAGLQDFKGKVFHSSGPTEDLDVKGKSVLVVGAGTSAHDIAQDLHLRGANVTMLQRSSTTVVGLEPASTRAYALYRQNERLRPIEETDLMSASIPFDMVRQLHGPLSQTMADDDKELLRGLRDAGFMLDNGEDDTGFFMKLLRSLSGYYINVGASDLIIEKKIGLKSGVEIECVEATQVRFTDGSSMPADVLVLATGYQPLQAGVRAMFGPEIAERVGPIWGLGEDGELRNMWVRTRQEGFYVAGGTLTMCRFYSHVTALLIKATLEGLIPASARAPYHQEKAS
ncbi:flavin-containing monooxygenase [Variovorax boronicumulans]|uniref:flavin-containing monooxygenase n=1 Tax=Variovorax boronicumulans TaxID=436515 RepID=UPI001C56FE00